jgi:hypothetical protein
MLHDFDLICHAFPHEITIYPIADVHLGAVEHCETEWQAFLRKVEQEDAYLILAGDLLNNSTRGTRFANPFDEVLRPRDAKRRMVEYLEPLKDRILCVVTGNHEQRSLRDTDSDLTYDICSKLDIEQLYRENVAYMSVSVGQRNTEQKALATYNFAVQHGSGGGIYTGAAVNRNERMGNVIDGLDCFVAGHVHKGFVSKPAKIVIDARNKKVCMKHYVVVSCVPWLAYAGYAAKAMLLLAQTCDPQRLRLVADKDRKKIITTW